MLPSSLSPTRPFQNQRLGVPPSPPRSPTLATRFRRGTPYQGQYVLLMTGGAGVHFCVGLWMSLRGNVPTVVPLCMAVSAPLGLRVCVISMKSYVFLLLLPDIRVCPCLSSHSSVCFPLYLPFLTSEPAHPPEQALRPLLRRRLKWAVAEAAVLRMELTVAASALPWVRRCSETPSPHTEVSFRKRGGLCCLCGSLGRGAL